MKRPLLIAVGNPLRGDDGVGPRLAELAARPGLDVLVVQQLTPELSEPVSGASVVIVVDASEDGPPGQVRVRTLRPADDASIVPLSHHTSPEMLLAFADRLFGRCPPAVIVTIGAAGFDLGAGLSPAVTAALPAALADVNRLLRPDSLPSLPDPRTE